MTDRVTRLAEQWRTERPDIDTSTQALFGRLHRLADRLRVELVAEHERHGLGEAEFDVLATLRREGAPYELAPGELARHTLVTTGAMSKRIDRLEEAGLVTRRVSDDDRRGRVVALTDAGRRVIDEAFTAHVANQRRLAAALSADERQELEALLDRWLSSLENIR